MKKKQSIALILLAMRITIISIFFCGMFAGSVYANKAEAQELLNKHITLSVENKQIIKVITAVQKQTGVKFLYSPTAIAGERKISCNVINQKLSDFYN